MLFARNLKGRHSPICRPRPRTARAAATRSRSSSWGWWPPSRQRT
jgi:hypothetical protein